MIHTPLLRSIPSPPLDWASFSIGPFTIHTYALIIVAGIIIATIWTNQRLTARGGEPWVVLDIVLWAVPLGLLGARLYHVFTHPADYFYDGAEWWGIFAIWEGGNAIIGSLIGGAIGAWIGCRFAGVRLLSFADAAAPAILLAQAIGRLGNWFNHELFGWPTDLPWGLEIESTNSAWPAGLPAGTLFHPTFLYELLWNLLGVAVILLLEYMFRMRWGKTLALYLIWYGLGRMVIESIRVDYSEVVLGMRSNVFGALLMVLFGIGLFIVQARRHRVPETSIYLPGREPLAEEVAKETATTDAEDAVVAVNERSPEPGDADGEDADAADDESEIVEEDTEPIADTRPNASAAEVVAEETVTDESLPQANPGSSTDRR